MVIVKSSGSRLAVRASTSGPFVHRGDAILVACAAAGIDGDNGENVTVSLRQLSEISVKGVDFLPNREGSRGRPRHEVLEEIQTASRRSPPELKIERFSRLPSRWNESIAYSETPVICALYTSDLDSGEYRVDIEFEASKLRETLYSEEIVVGEAGLCGLFGLDMILQPSFRGQHDAEVEAIVVDDLVAEVCEQRRGELFHCARESVEINFKPDLNENQIRAEREVLEVELRTVLAYAERFVFSNGTIEVSTMPGPESGSFRLEAVPQSLGDLQAPPGCLQDLILELSPDIQIGSAAVSRKSGTTYVTYNYTPAVEPA